MLDHNINKKQKCNLATNPQVQYSHVLTLLTGSESKCGSSTSHSWLSQCAVPSLAGQQQAIVPCQVHVQVLVGL